MSSKKCDIICCEAMFPQTWAYCDEHYQMLYGGDAPIVVMNQLQDRISQLEAAQPTEEQSDGYYLQDTRSMTGNDMVWWRLNGAGYTTNLREAGVFTRERAFKQNACRDTDRPWPKDYIDAHARPAVDFQHVDYGEATDTGEQP